MSAPFVFNDEAANNISVFTRPCGHIDSYECGKGFPESACLTPIHKKLPCGHHMNILCDEETRFGPVVECYQLCLADLECGHRCERKCHTEEKDHSKLKCLATCDRRCKRGYHRCQDSQKHFCGDQCGPCNESYEHKLACGHAIQIPCNEDPPDENTYKCTKRCQRPRGFCSHLCEKECWEECGTCEELVLKEVRGCERTPSHKIMVKCQEEPPMKCEFLVEASSISPCNHVVKVPCFEVDRIARHDLTSRCTAKCNHQFIAKGQCGHVCAGTCLMCRQGRFHVRCQEPCGKILICGHLCTFPCSMECRPCQQKCFGYCEHQQCEEVCGFPCEWNCEKPCAYKCKHSACTKKCSEVCNKKLCNEPCPEILECGHPCIGLCGEKCPPLCRVCHREELQTSLFSKCEVDETDRFLYLDNCDHVVEFAEFEQWLLASTSGNEILPFRCPHCGERIKWMHRYSAMMHENMEAINAVRRKIFGDVEEINAICDDVIGRLENFSVPSDVGLDVFGTNIIKEMSLTMMDISKAKFLKWLCDEYIEIGTKITSLCSRLPSEESNDFQGFWADYFDFISDNDRIWPLHPNELICLERERKRAEDATTLWKRLTYEAMQTNRVLLESRHGANMLEAAKDILRHPLPYTKERENAFMEKIQELDKFLRCTLNVPEDVKRQIVGAFGGATGRWFKCTNGHVYVVTECGAATERSKCPDCGATIGGENHLFDEGNYLAPEMDGADAPLYPTALMRPEPDIN